jgi:hypothetical protein
LTGTTWGAWGNIATIPNTTTAVLSYTETTVGTYKYRVIAVGLKNQLATSTNTVTVTIVAEALDPKAADFSLTETGNPVTGFTWTNTNATGVVTSYVVQRAMLAGGTWTAWSNTKTIAPTATLAYDAIAEDTAPGTYKYRVIAVAWTGQLTVSSNFVTVNVPLTLP